VFGNPLADWLKKQAASLKGDLCVALPWPRRWQAAAANCAGGRPSAMRFRLMAKARSKIVVRALSNRSARAMISPLHTAPLREALCMLANPRQCQDLTVHLVDRPAHLDKRRHADVPLSKLDASRECRQ
jgi:hypothetical protein